MMWMFAILIFGYFSDIMDITICGRVSKISINNAMIFDPKIWESDPTKMMRICGISDISATARGFQPLRHPVDNTRRNFHFIVMENPILGTNGTNGQSIDRGGTC